MRAWPSRTRLFSTQPPARSTLRREHHLGARRGAPVVGARPRAHRLPEAGEEARDLEGDELAGVGFDVARLVAAVGLDVVADEPQAPEQLAVIQALVTGVLILLFCVPTIASAFCVCPRTGVVTLPEPAPGASVVTSFQSYMRQPCVKPAWTPSQRNTSPTRYS